VKWENKTYFDCLLYFFSAEYYENQLIFVKDIVRSSNILSTQCTYMSTVNVVNTLR